MGKYLFIIMALTLCLGKTVSADETPLAGDEIMSQNPEEVGAGEVEDGLDHYVRVWTCYSRYVSPYGYRNYYGYAYNYAAAYNNGLSVCRYQHWNDPYNCVITGCFVR